MNTVSDRIKLYKYYINILFKNTYKKKIFDKIEVLGEGGQGKVYKYHKKDDKSMSGIAVKKMYLSKKESKYVDDIFDDKALNHSIYIELSSFYLINELVLQKISPNFVLNYDYEFMERSGICSDIYPYSGYFFNEYSSKSETYTEWVKKEHNQLLWYNSLFQIVSGVYTMQKYFNMTHLDLHSDNILVKKIKSGGYWKYIINSKEYNVPNMGYIFYINDFGHAYIPNTFKSWFRRRRYKKIDKSFDIYQLHKSISKISTSSEKFKKDTRYIIKNLKKDEDFTSIIENIWGDIYLTPRRSNKIETYNLDKPMITKQVPSELKQKLALG
jgi:hypothetical protein